MKQLIIVFFLIIAAVSAAENTAPFIKVKSGDTIDVPLMIDKADNLAGMKLVVNYDKALLNFREGSTSKNARSFMCMINDKQPGRLIVVIAAAKGISGRNLPIVLLTFEARKNLRGNHTTRLNVTETQLMNDQLKEIEGKISIRTIEILEGK